MQQWPHGATEQEQLWGNMEDLQKTTAFIPNHRADMEDLQKTTAFIPNHRADMEDLQKTTAFIPNHRADMEDLQKTTAFIPNHRAENMRQNHARTQKMKFDGLAECSVDCGEVVAGTKIQEVGKGETIIITNATLSPPE